MNDAFSDLRYAARTLLKSPGFTLVAIITLALGIGFNTALFSVIETVMLRPLPYPHPERLLAFAENTGGEGDSVSPANLADYARNSTLDGIVALALAVVGIYGVVAYSVQQRTGEIGIRVALGARETNILGMVIRQAVVLSAAGVGAGLIGAFATSRALASLRFGVRPVDTGTYLAVSLILIAATLGAAYLPARRASQTNPMIALRHE